MPDVFLKNGVVSIVGKYTADSPVPKSYLDWHQYASDMNALGIRQQQCSKCKLYSFPREIADAGGCPKCVSKS